MINKAVVIVKSLWKKKPPTNKATNLSSSSKPFPFSNYVHNRCRPLNSTAKCVQVCLWPLDGSVAPPVHSSHWPPSSRRGRQLTNKRIMQSWSDLTDLALGPLCAQGQRLQKIEWVTVERTRSPTGINSHTQRQEIRWLWSWHLSIYLSIFSICWIFTVTTTKLCNKTIFFYSWHLIGFTVTTEG